MKAAIVGEGISGAEELARLLCDELTTICGTRFSVLRNEELQPAALELVDLGSPLTEDILEALTTQASIAHGSFTLRLEGGRQLLVVSVPGDDFEEPCFVLGTIEDGSARLAVALADAKLTNLRNERRISQVQQQNEQCVHQITTDFEELSWLRAVVENFEIGDVNQGLLPLAMSVLPSLQELICAKALFCFNSRVGSDGRIEHTLLHGAGEIQPRMAAADQLLVEHLRRPRQGVQVFNARGSESSLFRNYILAPIASHGEQLGWLLAVDKVPPLDWHTAGEPSYWDPNLFEFGTTEAGLVTTVCGMFATHGRNIELFRDREAMTVGVLRALINTIDAKDAYTCGHSDRVSSMAKRMAVQLGLPEKECDEIRISGLLHDVGKIGIPDHVLGKPGKLTDEEFEIIKRHPVIGYEILKPVDRLSFVLPGVLHHHEAFNGTGYPDGLGAEEIPLAARIIAVADSYDAMTSRRPYRQGMPTSKAESILREGMGTQWDPAVGRAFFEAIEDIYDICKTRPAP
jgi:HD-GYP domain-containing protein (c-di-GMP phosphodiesterase class II)